MNHLIENKNKRWLSVTKQWKQQIKTTPESILFTKNNCSVLREFNKHEEELSRDLQAVDDCLVNNGMRKALDEMPSVGMLLSQLCKVPVISLSPRVHKTLISCIIHLSDLLGFNKVLLTTTTSSSAAKRSKKWAVEHFISMINIDKHIDGVGRCLIEEFGISPVKVMEEHVCQASLHVAQLVCKCKAKCKRVPGIIKDVLEFLEMADHSQNSFQAPFEEIIYYKCLVRKSDEDLDDFLSSMCQKPKVVTQLSIQVLHLIFRTSREAFEAYILRLIEKIIATYPTFKSKQLDDIVDEHRLVELCVVDPFYYDAIKSILKDSFVVVGVHFGLVELYKLFINKTKQFVLVTHNPVELHLKTLQSLFLTSQHGMHLEHKRKHSVQISDHVHKILFNEMDIRKHFELWMLVIEHGFEWFNFTLECLLFDEQRERKVQYVRFVLFFLYPVDFHLLVPCVPALVSYLNTLQDLVNEDNCIQMSDMISLSSRLAEQVPESHLSSLQIVVVMVNLLFLVKSNGSDVVCGNDVICGAYLENLLFDASDDVKHWFSYTVNILLKTDDGYSLQQRLVLQEAIAYCENTLDVT